MKKVLLLASLVLVSGAFAVTTARIDEIAQWLPEKPAADGARIADRAKWDALVVLPQAKDEIKAAESLLGQPVPDTPDELYLDFTRNGNRSRYETCFFRRLRNFNHLYVAECLENKGRFLPKIVEYVDALCAMKSWVLPAHDAALTCFNGQPHVDLVSGDISLMLAFCSDWLGDRLPVATRAKILAEVDRRTFRPVLRTARGLDDSTHHWWLRGENNWNSVCCSCVVRSALALVADRRLRAEFIAVVEESVPYAMKGYTADGYCSEGMDYWNYGYGHHVKMGLSVRAATGGKVDFFANPKYRTVMQYAYGFQVEDGLSPHFADGGGNADPCVLALGRQIWPDLANDAALDYPLLAGGPASFSLRAFGQEPARTAPTMSVLPIRSWFSDAQVLISRVHHKDRKLHFGIAIKGGHNAENHNHNDVGSYYVMLDGVEMSGDPDYEVYTRRTFSDRRYESKILNSYGHPVPVVGGELQQPGRLFAAKVLRTDFTDAKDVLEIEYASAYSVKTLKSLVRTMIFDRTTDVITITDRVVCTVPTPFEVPVITYRLWEKNADATEFVFRKNMPSSRAMKMSVKASAPVRFSKEIIENPGLSDVQRLAFTFAEPVTEATFTTVFSPETVEPNLAEMTSPVIFVGDAKTAYRDPAVYEKDGTFFLFFTVVKIEPDGGIYSYTAESESRNLVDWTKPRILTPRDQRLNYSSPGNVVKDGDDYVLCLQTYPRPGNTVANMPMYANQDARLFTMRSKDLRTWSEPELLKVKGPDVPVEKMGRMIDPYLLRDKDDPGKWWCFFKQNGASRAHSRDLKTWMFDGRVPAGENACVLVKDGEYVLFHSPQNGIAVKRSRDLENWTDDPKLVTLGQKSWNWAKGRITAGTVIDARHVKGVGKYLMFFHGSGPKTETEGDFDRNASIGIAWSDDLVNWDWPKVR